MASELPDGWKRWRGYSATVTGGEVGFVVTCPTDYELTLQGASFVCDAASKTFSIISAAVTDLSAGIGIETVVMSLPGDGRPAAAGADLTVKTTVSAAGIVAAWGLARPARTAINNLTVTAL